MILLIVLAGFLIGLVVLLIIFYICISDYDDYESDYWIKRNNIDGKQ